MSGALFSIEGDDGNAGYQASAGQTLTLRLRAQPPVGVNTVLFQVWNPAGADPTLGIAANPPRASKGAPTLTLVGSTEGSAVSPSGGVDGTVTVEMPGSGGHSYLIRCVVNGGYRQLPNGTQVLDPTLIHERGVWTAPAAGVRKAIATEVNQFEAEGWAGPFAEMADQMGIPDPVNIHQILRENATTGPAAAEFGDLGSVGLYAGISPQGFAYDNGFGWEAWLGNPDDAPQFSRLRMYRDGGDPDFYLGATTTIAFEMDRSNDLRFSRAAHPSTDVGVQMTLSGDAAYCRSFVGAGGGHPSLVEQMIDRLRWCFRPAGVDLPVIHAALSGSELRLGFFSASPVARPSITGATTQDQVDSLVAALTALGLVTDDR